MNIITNFKDYYDHVAYLGIDKTIPFKRISTKTMMSKTAWNYQSNSKDSNNLPGLHSLIRDRLYVPSNINVPKKGFSTILGVSDSIYEMFGLDKKISISSVDVGLFGFCGKLYPCEIIRFHDSDLLNLNDQVLFRNTVKGDAWAELQGYLTKSKKDSGWWHSSLYENEHNVSFRKGNIIDDETLFKELSTPYFLIVHTSWRNFQIHTDFPLVKTDFPSIMRPEQAWTQLEFFLTNTLRVNEREMLEVSDEYKIMGAGFDLKTSFRHPVNPAKIK